MSFLLGITGFAQEGIFNIHTGREYSKKEAARILPDTFALFGPEEPLNLEISSDFKNLVRRKYKPEYQPAMIVYQPNDSIVIRREIKVKARGNSRRSICHFPPLKLKLSKANFRYASLQDLDKMKMVSYCSKGKISESYILKEYLIYRMLNTLTPASFLVRLVRMRYVDEGSKKKKDFDGYAILIEPLDQLEKRLNATEVKNTQVHPRSIEQEHMALVDIFEFMIGNYDWSVINRHNFKIVKKLDLAEPAPYAIPYDFDYSGMVNANYAVPPEALNIKSVQTRLYRGFCRSEEALQPAIQYYLDKKEELFSLIDNFTYLEKSSRREMRDYLQEFYQILENEREVQYYFFESCRRK